MKYDIWKHTWLYIHNFLFGVTYQLKDSIGRLLRGDIVHLKWDYSQAVPPRP